MTTQIYNISPYRLRISIQNENQAAEEHSSVPDRGRLFSMPSYWQWHEDYVHITIGAYDWLYEPTETIKTVSFYSNRGHSWIVSDTEVRRRRAGAQPHVADQYTVREMRSSFPPGLTSERNNCDVIKQYYWTHVRYPCIYTDVRMTMKIKSADRDVRMTNKSADRFEYLKQLYRSASLKYLREEHQRDANEFDYHPRDVIFNDSPYYLDVHVQKANTSKTYWNDPESGDRRVRFRPADDGNTFIVITVFDSVGMRVKFASFYSSTDDSWIVHDECVVRRQPDAAPYVAEQSVEGVTTRYDWRCPNIEAPFTFYVAPRVDDDDKMSSIAESAREFFDRNRSGAGFASMCFDERFVVMMLIECASFGSQIGRAFTAEVDNPDRPVSAFITTECSVTVADLLKMYSLKTRQLELSKFRVRYTNKECVKYPNYDQCSISKGSQTYAIAYFHTGIDYTSESYDRLITSLVRYALHMSLNFRTDVWVSHDHCDVRHTPTKQPDLDNSKQYQLLASFSSPAEGNMKGYFRFWINDRCV